MHIDSGYHNNGTIMKSTYAEGIEKLIVLDAFSDTFVIYSEDCKVLSKFRPSGLHIRG